MYRAPARAIAVLLLSLSACGPSEPPVSRGDAPLVGAFERAAEQTGVPIDLLLAIAYTESRFSTRHGPSLRGGHGLMHLRTGSTLARASALSGLDEQRLIGDPEANVLGAALVLAGLAGEERPLELERWRAALASYSGLGAEADRYAGELLALVARGVEGADEQGRAIRIPAHPEIAGALSPGVGRWQGALTPDYSGAQWQGPACNSSSRTSAISMVVIHTCQGGFSGCWGWLKQCDNNSVSAHYVISSTGTVVQLVEEKLKGWHAGCVNDRSVGIEHEGFVEDPAKWYTEAMYCASAKLVRSICTRNNFPCDRDHVIGHKEANDLYCHGTHTDPGAGWSWTKFMTYVNSGCGGEPPPVDRPQLSISSSIADIAGQAADLCETAASRGVFDWWTDQTTDVTVDVKNGGKVAAADVEVGIWAEQPHLSVLRWEILSDAGSPGTFKLNDTDAMQKVPRESPGQTFRLWLAAFAPGETKRVALKVRAGSGSLATNIAHPDLRAWVAKIGGGLYEKSGFDEKPAVNLDGSQTQNGGDLKCLVQTDVLEKEVCGDGSDNDCNGLVDDHCGANPPDPPPPTTPPPSGGCGCELPGPPSPGAPVLLVLALLALVRRRR